MFYTRTLLSSSGFCWCWGSNREDRACRTTGTPWKPWSRGFAWDSRLCCESFFFTVHQSAVDSRYLTIWLNSLTA